MCHRSCPDIEQVFLVHAEQRFEAIRIHIVAGKLTDDPAIAEGHEVLSLDQTFRLTECTIRFYRFLVGNERVFNGVECCVHVISASVRDSFRESLSVKDTTFVHGEILAAQRF